jgi:hypothetical protein
MPAPKDPVKRAEWIERISTSKIGQGKGIPLSEEHAKKISERSKGVPKSDTAKENMSKARMGKEPWNKGVPHSDAAKAKMSAKKIGIPLSEEHKKNLSIAHKGKVPNITPEAIKKNRLAHIGKKASDETKALMSIAHKGKITWNKGIPSTPEARKNQSDSLKGKRKSETTRKNMSGSNNHRWNGGITPFLKTIRELPEMYEWKSNVMRRDEYKDCFTGIVGNHNLEVHHIIPMSIILLRNNIDTVEEALNCKALWDISNGITMFKKSHLAHHNKYGMSILPKSHYSQKSK